MLTQAVFLFLSGKTKLGCSHDAAKYALARSGDHTPRCGPTHVFGHFYSIYQLTCVRLLLFSIVPAEHVIEIAVIIIPVMKSRTTVWSTTVIDGLLLS